MKVTMKPELWEAVIVAIDNDLDDYHSMGTDGDQNSTSVMAKCFKHGAKFFLK